MTLLKLPPEIHVQIIEHFDWHSFLHYRHACKYFYSITESLPLEQVWHRVWPLKPLTFDLSMVIYYKDFLRKYKEIYALCLTMFTTTCCQGIELPADISAFRQRYNYVGKARMFEVYKEIQTTRGLPLIALGDQICHQHIKLEYGFIVDFESMCLDILDYIMTNADDADVLEQYVAMRHHILRELATLWFAIDDKMMPNTRAYGLTEGAEATTRRSLCELQVLPSGLTEFIDMLLESMTLESLQK